jgi:hypothetical protein
MGLTGLPENLRERGSPFDVTVMSSSPIDPKLPYQIPDQQTAVKKQQSSSAIKAMDMFRPLLQNVQLRSHGL